MPQAARSLTRLRKPSRGLRGTSQERGYDNRWRVASLAFLRMNPLCCGWNDVGEHAAGCNGLATETDHRLPVQAGQSDPLFWDVSNWRPRSKQCHAKKTQFENR